MRIAIDARLVAGTSTGDSSYWTCLIDALARNFVNDEFFLFSNIAKPPNVPSAPNLKWHIVPANNTRIWSLISFPRVAKKLGCEVTHVQYSLSPFAVNPVTTIHDVSFFIGPEWFPEKDRKLLQKTVPISARMAKRVITVSETSRQEIVRFIPGTRDKIRVALNATPYWIEKVAAQDAQKVLFELGIKPPFFLTVGTNWARKNMQLAVDATRNLGIPLIVTGKQGDTIKAPHVRAVGYVDNQALAALYSTCTMYLAPSLHEGFGIPILEAFRCGAPVICGYGGAMPEIAGTCAIVKRDYDAGSWEKSIKEALADQSKLEAMRMAAMRREAGFTWDASAIKHMEIYKEALEN